MTQAHQPQDEQIQMLEAEMTVDHNLRARYEIFREAGIVTNLSEFINELREDFWNSHPELRFVDVERQIPAEAWMQRGAKW